MTARQRAIAAMKAENHRYAFIHLTDKRLAQLLDAIPGDVLVRLAIERDELEEQSLAAWWMQDTDPDQPLFRLVES
jgi:hypothetical protein